MKKINAPYILLFAQLFICLISCEKFVENVDPPLSRVPADLVFASGATATAATLGIYVTMHDPISFASGSNRSVTSLCGLSADELISLPSGIDNNIVEEIEQNNILNTNEYILGLWRSMYQSIYQANSVLEGLASSSNVPDALKNQLRGEVLFIRAFSHFYLINIFGKAPLVTSTDYLLNAKLYRSNIDEVYEQITADLLEAKSLLVDEYPQLSSFAAIERVRPNKQTATALLARVYLYRQNWGMAESESSEIINRTVTYYLPDSLKDVFLKQSTEAIWQISPSREKYNTNEGYHFVGQFPDFTLLNNSILAKFELTDKRRNNWVGTSGSFNYPYKYKQGVSPSDNVTEYSIVFRLAEQFLIRAEARAMLNKLTGTNGATEDLNKIRNRAGLPGTTATSQADIILAIEHERNVELFTEWGHRWFDLKRWNRAVTVLGPQKTGFNNNDLLYPVPQKEIDRNRNLLPQNEGY